MSHVNILLQPSVLSTVLKSLGYLLSPVFFPGEKNLKRKISHFDIIFISLLLFDLMQLSETNLSLTDLKITWYFPLLGKMGHFSSMFNGLARSLSIKKPKNSNGKSYAMEAAEEMAREAKKKELILKSSGCINADGSHNLASVFSKRGEKGVNQDCAIVWEVH